jgi:hypothetical protein
VSDHVGVSSGSDHQDIRRTVDAAHAETRAHEADFLGLTEPDAQALADHLDIELRVIRDDDTALHLDFRPRRVTVDLRTGVVTLAEAG